MFFGTELSTSFSFIHHWLLQKVFWFSLTNSKFSVNVCSFFGFPSVKIKSDDRYQIGQGISSDSHRPILYHVISFIQWEPAEIIRWVIKKNNLQILDLQRLASLIITKKGLKLLKGRKGWELESAKIHSNTAKVICWDLLENNQSVTLALTTTPHLVTYALGVICWPQWDTNPQLTLAQS